MKGQDRKIHAILNPSKYWVYDEELLVERQARDRRDGPRGSLDNSFRKIWDPLGLFGRIANMVPDGFGALGKGDLVANRSKH